MTSTSNENNNIETLLQSIGTQQNVAFNFQQNLIESNVSLNQTNQTSNVFREEEIFLRNTSNNVSKVEIGNENNVWCVCQPVQYCFEQTNNEENERDRRLF